jgi:hydrogenase nickel incorporation protein HypB
VTQVDVRQRILSNNTAAAAKLRERFSVARTLVLNLISSPGSGKTTLLEATVRSLAGRLKLGAIEGDIATERDADRLRVLGIPAHQILTGGSCHLDARQVQGALETHDLGPLDVLFIENVGNLVCPTSYDLGEDFKVALLSVTEGEDKPFKYPSIFAKAAVTVVTKADLLPYVSFKLDEVRAQVVALRPGGELLVTSASTGQGIAEWCALIEQRLAAKRGGTA